MRVTPHDKSSRNGKPDEESSEGSDYQMTIIYTVASLLFFAVGVGFFINLFFYAGDPRQKVIAIAGIIVFATLGAAAYALGQLPLLGPQSQNPNTDAIKKLAAQSDATLRPYLGVSAVRKKRMEIGKTVWIVIEFTNNGKTPANNAEVRGRLQKIPTGTPLDRTYTGAGFKVISREHVNVGDTIAADFVSQNETSANALTLDDVMQLTTDKSYILAVHGIVRYHSIYIPGGIEETPFCYEFDPISSEMIGCRVASSSATVKPAPASGANAIMVTAERAYLRFSPEPPGVLFHSDKIILQMRIENMGKTPANVIDVALWPYSETSELPDQPPRRPTWIHTDTALLLLRNVPTFLAMSWDDHLKRTALFVSGKIPLWVLGYVDYRDEFRQRHRLGVAWRYDYVMDPPHSSTPPEKRMNLHAVMKTAYNFDRERVKGEGNDWEQSQQSQEDS